MALALAEAGADLILVGRDRPALEATGADVERRGRSAALIQADVSQPLEAERACRTALEQHGPVHILINNVGGRRIDVATEDLDLEQWQEIVDLNLTSTFICTKLIGGAMVRRGQGGRVINIASVSGLHRDPRNRWTELRDGQGRRHPLHACGRRRLGTPIA